VFTEIFLPSRGWKRNMGGGMRIFLFAYLVRKPVSYEKDGG
jgi:hypothetical protein